MSAGVTPALGMHVSTQIQVLLSYVCSDLWLESKKPKRQRTSLALPVGPSPAGLLRDDFGVSFYGVIPVDRASFCPIRGRGMVQVCPLSSNCWHMGLCSREAVPVVISLEFLREEGVG